MTLPTQLVLAAFLEAGTEERYGLEVAHAAGLATGTVHPILARLEAIGWLRSRWEDIDPRAEGRPQRRYYQLTAEGASSASASLARVARPALSRLRPTTDIH
jgi:PadR family transcriptional regulator, regulatory protein PadR